MGIARIGQRWWVWIAMVAAVGATLLGDEPVAVPYAGPVIVVGKHLFEGDVACFTLADTPAGPVLSGEVTPAG